jgi:hypothetical protein
MMLRLRGGVVKKVFNNELFIVWELQPIIPEEYPYMGMDFKGDLVLPLPARENKGSISMYLF